jgi:hypothetical protein
MTIKEAIIKSLEDINGLTNSLAVYNHIIKNNYCEFRGETPVSTVSAQLGEFIRKGDSRVKRISESGGTFSYYLTKNEANLTLDIPEITETVEIEKPVKVKKTETYDERDLHKLLSTFLKTSDTYSKTIFHEQSNRSDEHQKWIHPDMVGIKFLKLQKKASQSFLKTINRVDTFKISSYEIKKELNSDYELKKSFFQAVSNSSWANYGYLVAFDINSSLSDEMERLSQSFGIGIIQLKANPFESRILYPAKLKDFDFKTIDKLCKISKEFEKFIEQADNHMNAADKYEKAVEKEMDEFCDRCFQTDSEAENYCIEKHIPIELIANDNIE